MSVKSPKQLNASFKPQFLRGLISLVSFLSPFNKVFLLQKVEVVELRETMRTLDVKNEILLN